LLAALLTRRRAGRQLQHQLHLATYRRQRFGAVSRSRTGPAITNGWTMVFNFPNGQQLQDGWPVTVTQSGM
jgi:hypothetical protein